MYAHKLITQITKHPENESRAFLATHDRDADENLKKVGRTNDEENVYMATTGWYIIDTVDGPVFSDTKPKFLVPKVVIRQYRCFDPLNWDDDAQEQLWLINKFWNTLVKNENALYERYRAIMATDDAVASIEQKIADGEANMETLIDDRKKIRIEIKKKKGPATVDLDKQIAALSKELKEKRKEAREARKQAKESVKPLLNALNNERKEMNKEAYKDSQLWWCNYNGVINSMDVSRVRTMKTGGQLRFHRFDGSGRFRIQVQGGMSIDDLRSGKKSQISLMPIDAEKFCELTGKPNGMKKGSSRERRRSYALLKFTIYTGTDEHDKRFNRTLDFPVILHRPLPDNDKVRLKEVILKRERLAPGQFRWHITFTMTKEVMEQKTKAQGKPCGINMGWKNTKEGLRVATLTSDSEVRHFVLPTTIISTYLHLHQLQSEIDTAANDNDVWIKSVLTDPPDSMLEAFTAIKRSKKPHPAKFARLVHAWKDSPQFLSDAYHEALPRVAQNLRRQHELANLRDKVQGRRKDLYRCWAKEIAESYGQIAIDEMNLAELAKVEKQDGTPNELTQIAKRNRVIASLGLFREWIKKQATKTGSTVALSKKKTSSICSECGKSVSKQKTLVWRCPHCKALWDQDENASINLMRTLSDSAILEPVNK